MTPAELREIVAAAATLPERFSDQFVPLNTPDQEALIEVRLARWRQTAAQGNQERFLMRLAAEGLDEERIRPALARLRLRDDAPLPQWAQTLADVFHHLQTAPDAQNELFYPFIHIAKQRLTRRAGTLLALLTEQAQADLEDTLRKRFSEIAFPAIATTGSLTAFAPLSPQAWQENARRYPVLVRLLAEITDFWVETSGQLIERLAADWEAIRETFCPPENLGSVTALASGLSDPHLRGQTVAQVTFSNGLTLFYKPRNLAIESAWFDLLQSLNQTGSFLPLTCLRIFGRNTHGWMERAETRPCEDDAQAERFYRRAGHLLCLLYLFTGSDFHGENVIASGEQPVLVDLETLMTPNLHELRLFPERISETVLRTHFLLSWKQSDDDELQAVGGMNVAMPAPNAAVEAGFLAMARWIISHKETMLRALSRFDGLPLRVIFQDTRTYRQLMQRSLHLDFLGDAIDRRIELEWLARIECPPEQYAAHLARVRHEIAMLEQLDIPYFETRSDTTDLIVSSGETRRDYFAEPCLQNVKRHIREFDAQDAARQLRLIRDVFLFEAAAAQPQQAIMIPAGSPKIEERRPHETFEATAEALAETLKKMAIRTASGGVVWMIPEKQASPHGLTYRYRQGGSGIYQGNTGIALFLAAMETVRPDAGYGDLAQAALHPLSQWLQRPWCSPKINLGITNGLGSFAYAFARIGTLLFDSELIEQARRIAALITADRIHADAHLDIFHGAAGAMLALLAVYRATNDSSILAQAIQCGDHLLFQRTTSRPRAWQTIRPAPIGGFSHGAAGIAYALLRLFAIVGRESFRQAAEEGIAFERLLFSAAEQNWRAFDSSAEQPEFWTAYCHGAPGIGLARLGGLDILDTSEIRADIAAALYTTSAVPLDGLDFLCCGNFGRLELLLSASRFLFQPTWHDLARQQASAMIARQAALGGFSVFEFLPPDVINPAFFTGIAGIGYELLRLSAPEKFPNILLWE